jgi:hypothetical protein
MSALPRRSWSRRGSVLVATLAIATVVLVSSACDTVTGAGFRATTTKPTTTHVVSSSSSLPSHSHGGAIPAPATDAPPICTSSQLTSQYWTSVWAMHQGMSGLNVINASSQPCDLPEYPVSVTVANSTGAAVAPTTLFAVIGTSGSLTSQDFLDYSTAVASNPFDVRTDVLPASTPALELEPGGEAVLVLFTGVGGFNPGDTCLSVPVDGSLMVSLDSQQTVVVPVPIYPAPPSPEVDSDASAFFSCASVVVAPFLTWTAATAVVGPAGYNLATVNDALYQYAP